MVKNLESPRLSNIGTTTPRNTLDRLSPTNGDLIYKTPMSGIEEVSLLFQNIHAQEFKFQDLGVVKAAQILVSVCQELKQRKDEINHCVFLETAKPENLIAGEFDAAINFMTALSGLSQFISGKVIPSKNPKKTVYTKNYPYGVSALITSHNTPLPNYAWKLAPSFLALNSSVLKPSEFTSLSAQKFVESFLAAGAPEYMVNLLHGGPETVSSLISFKPELISFTGSFEVGMKVKAMTNNYNYSPKLILEMGGSNPIIVCKSANLELAADAIVESAFSNSGQRCAAGSRLIAHNQVLKELLELVRIKTQELTLHGGNELFSGGLVNQQAKERHQEFIRKVSAASLEYEEFGAESEKKGVFVSPTIIKLISGVELNLPEEVFSPILRVVEFETYAEALELANASVFGLTAAVWTNDINEADHFIRYIKSGIVNINGPTHGAEFQFPFGGQKNSGNGAKEVGLNSLSEYSFEKLVSFTNYA